MATFYCSTARCPFQWKNFRGKDVVRGPKCLSCGVHTTRLAKVPPGAAAYRLPDIPEHFNISFDERVHGRRHFKELQRVNKTKDWEPTNHLDEIRYRQGLIR